ncbi:MAG: hypothetical protein Q7T49_01015 [bacterium]|nr:hypothetical protein [bacterium]
MKSKLFKWIFYPIAFLVVVYILVLSWPVILNQVNQSKWDKFTKERENTFQGKFAKEKDDQEKVLSKASFYPGECPWFDIINTQFVFKDGVYFINNFCLNSDKSQSINEFYSYSLKRGFTELYTLSQPTWVGSEDSYKEGKIMYKTYDLMGILEDSKLILKDVIDRDFIPNRLDKDKGCGIWSDIYKTLGEYNNQEGFYVLDSHNLEKGIYRYKLPSNFLESQREATFPCQLDRFGEIKYGS